MNDLVLTLPGEALANARIPPAELERELRRRLAAALFSDGIVGGARCLPVGRNGQGRISVLAG